MNFIIKPGYNRKIKLSQNTKRYINIIIFLEKGIYHKICALLVGFTVYFTTQKRVHETVRVSLET